MDGRVCAKCRGPGNLACRGCLLVVFCSRECQLSHWGQHKQSCKSPIGKNTWEPHWVSEGRTPAFIGGALLQQFGGKKYFWGNVPALDIIQLPENEGKLYQGDLRLLFAASGDLRNVVKSVASLPEEYTKKALLFINDMDFEVVARNLIIALIALVVPDEEQAVHCMLHIWYSALIRQSDSDVLANKVLPLIEDVNRKVRNKPPGTVLGKTWTFGSHSFRVELTKERWNSMLSYVEAPRGLSAAHAQSIRTAVTLAAERKDHRERRLFAQQPAHRICAMKFLEDGLLLPFGHERETFTVPNPTFFQNTAWPMKDNADPVNGWSLPEILRTKSGAATNDLYGKLFYHVRNLLTLFHRRLALHGSESYFFNVNATEISKIKSLEGIGFARIEVANLSDGGYLGIAQTLAYMGPLLMSPCENAYATLITLFMNAVDEVVEQSTDNRTLELELSRAAKFLRLTSIPHSRYDPRLLLNAASNCLVRDVDAYFTRYMEINEFKDIEEYSGMLVEGGLAMKESHTIVKKWPMRLKLQFGQVGAQEEFDVLQSSGHSGSERYVEWKRKA